jgi:hypothetical protein
MLCACCCHPMQLSHEIVLLLCFWEDFPVDSPRKRGPGWIVVLLALCPLCSDPSTPADHSLSSL